MRCIELQGGEVRVVGIQTFDARALWTWTVNKTGKDFLTYAKTKLAEAWRVRRTSRPGLLSPGDFLVECS